MTIAHGHPILWILVASVVAPLLAEIPFGFKVPVVVLEPQQLTAEERRVMHALGQRNIKAS